MQRINFGDDDRLWLVGDLINRGPDSLQVLRLIHAMGSQASIVLGNHEMHFLAIVLGGHSAGRSDTFSELLAAPDVDELAHWLCQQKLLHHDAHLNCVMAHAGIPHIWSLDEAKRLASEVEQVMQGQADSVSAADFFKGLYGNEPDCWDPALASIPRLRLIANYFTRMRLIDVNGRIDFKHKGALADAPEGWLPWYQLVPQLEDAPRLLFGHWAAIEGVTGRDDIVALDTGCVWGRQLTALCLESNELIAVDALV